MAFTKASKDEPEIRTSKGHCLPNESHISPSPLKTELGPVDVAIIGGGASGLAVAIQLIERVKAGKELSLITLIEKGGSVGTGLAYSEACSNSIVNMHSDTMGLCPINPLQFSHWVQEVSPNLNNIPFPSRAQYGQYLKALLDNVIEDSKALGVKFDIIMKEAVDLCRNGEVFDVTLDGGHKLKAFEVVLALGNFCSNLHTEFRGNPAYFRCPWPLEKLKGVKPDSSIFVIGSRLTAIDAANALAEHGHQGGITFISRTGQLPKVQGKPSVFPRHYMMYTLAKEVEGLQEGVLSRVMSQIKKEIEENGTTNFDELSNPQDPLTTLRLDIAQAVSGSIPWQSVIISTRPLVEKYWNCFTPEEKQQFLEQFNSTWVTYRHSIPLENARKVLALLENGQLRVIKGGRVQWDGENFFINIGEQEHKAQFMIETLGQEFDMSKIESKFVQNILSSGIITPHLAGGVTVDFKTLKATEGIHVIGSMTRGTHFYTTAIDRNAAHASRIADSIAGMPYRRPLHVAFFAGSDLFSHLMLSKLVPQLLALGHFPFIFLPSDKVNAKPQRRPYPLQRLTFFERTLLQETIIPYLGPNIHPGAASMTVEQMKAKYGILVQAVSNINCPTFLQKIKDNYIDIGFSLRCYQKFGLDLINHFDRPRALLNLHPGVLPQYRGVITAMRAMMNGEKEFGYSLHHIDEHFDAGDVIDIRTKPLDYTKSMLGNMENLYETGVQMVLDATEKFARGGDLHEGKIPQDPAKSCYYTFATERELETCREKGIRLVDGLHKKELLVKCFAGKGNEDELRQVIDDASLDWMASAHLVHGGSDFP